MYLTTRVEVLADADFIIEGYVDPNDELIWKGRLVTIPVIHCDWYPKFHITAVRIRKMQFIRLPLLVFRHRKMPGWEKLPKGTGAYKMTMVPGCRLDMPIEGVFHNLVITKIKKDYAGQGQKVMNAMWGAGQMMFNKILVLADEGVKIQDYEALAKYVFKNLNPATDIYFSTGPMDVLDHSCSKLGFGGKMCIDGTAKMEEEMDDSYEAGVLSLEPAAIAVNLKNRFPEISSVNVSFLKYLSPVLI
jgi:4-hydroxy-3-polyprenylbenzoate decarboxylase